MAGRAVARRSVHRRGDSGVLLRGGVLAQHTGGVDDVVKLGAFAGGRRREGLVGFVAAVEALAARFRSALLESASLLRLERAVFGEVEAVIVGAVAATGPETPHEPDRARNDLA